MYLKYTQCIHLYITLLHFHNLRNILHFIKFYFQFKKTAGTNLHLVQDKITNQKNEKIITCKLRLNDLQMAADSNIM